MNQKRIIRDFQSENKIVAESAFNEIYNEYSYLVYYISLKIVKDNDLALEITNECFYQLFKNRFNLDNNKNLKYYLTTISKNTSLNYLRQQKHFEPLNDIYSYNPKYNDFENYLKEFTNFLDELELETLIYHFLYDFTFKEIAKDKNVSINIITGKYQRAIKKIKKYYKENDKL